MHIVAHNGAPHFGGAERATTLLLAGLQRRGHRVLLFCNNTEVASRAAEFGIPTDVLRLGGDIMLPDAVRFGRALRALGPDAVILSTFRKLWLGAMGAWLAGVPRVVARIGLNTDAPRGRKYRAVFTHGIDAVVLRAADARPRYLGSLPGIDPRRIIVVDGGVAPRPITGAPGAVRESLGVPDGAVVIGAVGRLAEQKRFDRLLRSVAALPEHVHCILAGDGDQRVPLEELADQLGIRNRVHLLGEREDVGDVLAALDVFVVCSDYEGMANAMLEALAAGLPVVSTPVSGAADALAPFNGGTAPGVVVGWEQGELDRVLQRLAANPEGRRLMGNAAVRRWSERFNFERMIDRWEAVLAGTGYAA